MQFSCLSTQAPAENPDFYGVAHSNIPNQKEKLKLNSTHCFYLIFALFHISEGKLGMFGILRLNQEHVDKQPGGTGNQTHTQWFKPQTMMRTTSQSELFYISFRKWKIAVTRFGAGTVLTCASGGPPSSLMSSRWLWPSTTISFLKRPPAENSGSSSQRRRRREKQLLTSMAEWVMSGFQWLI